MSSSVEDGDVFRSIDGDRQDARQAPGEPIMAQVMVVSTPDLALRDDASPWSFGEYAVLAGWAFFLLSLLKGLWSALHWQITPRKPGSKDRAENTQEQSLGVKVCSQCGRTSEGEEPRRDRSPSRERTRRRQISITPEKKRSADPSLVSPGRSPEAQAARTQILEAMVQRAQPVVQDLHDMHRLGGVAPGPMLRRGSRIQ